MTRITIRAGRRASVPSPTTSFSFGIVPYMHKEDRQVFGGIRGCASCPAVFVLKDDNHVSITKQWQYYLLAINPSMTLENVFLLLDNNLAFTNSTGFRNDGDPRADYFHNRNTTDGSKPPQFDKVRTCSRNSLTGVEQYSLVQALKNTQIALQARQRGFSGVRKALVEKNVLNVRTFDSRFAPPLKFGRSYPSTISQINPDDYLYLPQYNREMFIVANIVNRSGEVVQFPRGGLYSWTGDSTTYSFLPHISNPAYGPVLYSLDRLSRLPVGSPVPRPYRMDG